MLVFFWDLENNRGTFALTCTVGPMGRLQIYVCFWNKTICNVVRSCELFVPFHHYKLQQLSRGGKGGATLGAGRDMSHHFCRMYHAGGTTQFTLYTCGVLQPAAKVTQFTFGFSTWKLCFLFLYSLLLVIQSRKLGSWILHCWRTW